MLIMSITAGIQFLLILNCPGPHESLYSVRSAESMKLSIVWFLYAIEGFNT